MARISSISTGGGGEFAPGSPSPAIAPIFTFADYKLQPGSRLHKTTAGLDEITRVWQGPKEGAYSFATAQTRDPDFRALKAVDFDVLLMEGALCEVSVTFRGSVTQQSGEFNRYASKSLATSSTEMLIYLPGLKTITFSIQYMAPSTTHRWVTSSLPGDTPPAFVKNISNLNPWDYITDTRVTIPSGTTITYDAITALLNGLRSKYKNTDQIVSYNPEMSVQDSYWECEAKISRLIKQPVIVS